MKNSATLPTSLQDVRCMRPSNNMDVFRRTARDWLYNCTRLESANKSLQKSAREEKRVKKQRLLWQIIAGSAVVVLVKEKL